MVAVEDGCELERRGWVRPGSLVCVPTVIRAAGRSSWIPACAGMTNGEAGAGVTMEQAFAEMIMRFGVLREADASGD